MRALSLDIRHEEAPTREQHRGHSGGGQDVTAVGSPEPVPGASSPPHTSQGLGATGAVTTGIGGYANVPAASMDTHRQTASRYRA
jgi:hypothetical protein